MAIVVVVGLGPFLTVLFGLAVEELEEAKGLDLELSDRTSTEVSAGLLRLAAAAPSLNDLNCTAVLSTVQDSKQWPNTRTSPTFSFVLP